MVFQPDARQHRRIPTDAPGWIGGVKGNYIRCTVTNITVAGAQLQFDRHTILPTRFPLIANRDARDKVECQLVWRKGNRVGVRFIEPEKWLGTLK